MAFLAARDPQSTPASPVTSHENIEASRPEIGGSYGGFVALVVVLAAVFVFSCIGIFILLRSHEPTPYERQMRRARSRSRAQFTGEAPIGPPGIRERFARLFGRRGGWIKASGTDGDEWDPSDPLPYHASELRQGDHRGYPSMVSNPSWTSKDPRQNVGPRASTGSVDVELRAPSPDSLLSTAFQHDLLPSEDSVEAVSAPAKPMGVGGGFENDRAGAPRDERHFSVQMASQESGSISLGSMRKFDNGTKFRESI